MWNGTSCDVAPRGSRKQTAIWVLVTIGIMVLATGTALASAPQASPFGTPVALAEPTPAHAPTFPVPGPASGQPNPSSTPTSGPSLGTSGPLTVPGLGGMHIQSPLIRASHVPQSWASLRTPSGAYSPPGVDPTNAPWANSWGYSNSSTNQSGLHCVGYDTGVWAQYGYNCVGHDEPSIDFYSTLPGSAGNVTWNVTLPVDRSPTQNQSDLYIAIWFGMTLSDPSAWENACFLELQFYPDSTWANTALDLNGTVTNNWIAAAFAWQLVPGAGAGNLIENPCFLQPLYSNGYTSGNSFFNMQGGDKLTLTFQGWPGDPKGETIAVADHTQGTATSMDLYNGSCANYQEWFGFRACGGNYPLDPAYTSNSYQESMPWSPTTVYPAAFAFEVGHAGNPAYPNKGLFGGCYPGWDHLYGTTYCPTYNPSSWANDTAQPWEIQPPYFFNAHAHQSPAQVAFNQDLGGEAFSNGTAWSNFAYGYDYGLPNFGCTPKTLTGTEHCSYPWYSYSCSSHAFEFGATDYPGVTSDFGKWRQFTDSWTTGPEAGIQGGLMPTNFTIPVCSGSGASLSLGVGTPGQGSIYFLSHEYTSTATVRGLTLGEYSLHATPSAGLSFAGWYSSGGVKVAQPASPWTSVYVEGNGTLVANFSKTAPKLIDVYFNDSASGAEISLVPGFTEAFQPQIGDLASGTMEALPPGIYSVQAIPPAGSATSGFLFSNWSISKGGNISAPYWAFAWLTIDGSTSSVSLEAYYTPSTLTASPLVEVIGDATAVTFNGVALTPLSTSTPTVYVNPSGLAGATMAVGGYTLSITPAAGWVVVASEIIEAMSIDTHSNSMAVYLQPTPSGAQSEIVVIMAAQVTLADSPATGGEVAMQYGSFNGLLSTLGLYPPGLLPSGPLPSGTVLDLPPSTVSCAACTPTTITLAGPYSLFGIPSASTSFSSWSVSTGANITVASSGAMYTTALIDNTGTLTANYVSAANHSVTFYSYPSNGGEVDFNFQTVASGAPGINATNGTYLVYALPAPGFKWIGFEPWGGVSTAPSCFDSSICNELNVSGNGFVYALFAPLDVRVSFTTNLPGWVSATLNGTSLANGGSTELPFGTAPLDLVLPSGVRAAVDWTATEGLSPQSASAPATNLSIAGPGTLYAEVGAAVTTPGATLRALDVGMSVDLSVTAAGYGNLTYMWNGLPSGCSSQDSANLTCAPTSAGTYNITVTVTSSAGPQVTSLPVTLAVGLPLSTTAVLSASASDVGIPLEVSIVPTGGVAPYAYEDSHVPAGCSPGASGSVLTCTEALPGSYSGTVSVTDAAGVTVSTPFAFTVNPLPQVATFTASPAALLVNGTTFLNVSETGGTAPLQYSYAGLPPGCASVDAATLTCRPDTTGTFGVTASVRDADNVTAQAFIVLSVGVALSSPHPVAVTAFTASPNAIDLGGTVDLNVTVTGGTAPFTYNYSGLPNGCSPADSPTLTCTPTATGDYTVMVTVRDAQNQTASAFVSFTVASTPTPASSQGPAASSSGLLALVALILAVLALVAAGVALAARRRERRQNEPPLPWATQNLRQGSPSPGPTPPGQASATEPGSPGSPGQTTPEGQSPP